MGVSYIPKILVPLHPPIPKNFRLVSTMASEGTAPNTLSAPPCIQNYIIFSLFDFFFLFLRNQNVATSSKVMYPSVVQKTRQTFANTCSIFKITCTCIYYLLICCTADRYAAEYITRHCLYWITNNCNKIKPQDIR